ncbi:MAG: bifunctional methylenetetrahydrofolate dehydrogenase/methenyltetrahydrofolate cyclohydrolase FolD [Myxococcota bacterium]
MGGIIDGREVAAKVRAEVRERVAQLSEAGVRPGLAVVLVGDDAPSQVYVRHKARACEKAGIASFVRHLPAETTQREVLALVERLNGDRSVHGILVQLPLPEHISEYRVLQAIRPDKDADAFHALNMGELVADRPELAPCTPKGVMRLLETYDVPTRGAHAVVIGRSRVVGRPMGAMLLAADATVTVCHRHTRNTRELAARADIVVTAVGKAGLVRGDWVKEGAVVLDVGITRGEDGKLRGDVLWEEVSEKASLVTPVPGGVGPMTIAMLLENTCLLAEQAARAA